MSKKKILVVDDEPIIRELLQLVLADAGYEVVTAHNGASAIETIQSQPFDLVFLDILLPDCFGSSVYEQIRKLYPSLPICIQTAMDERRYNEHAKGIEIGAQDLFLRKPIAPDKILKAARQLLKEDRLSGKEN